MLRRTPLKRSGFKKKRKINYKAKLWKIFSQFIRRRDADSDGMVKCVSCPTVKHWSQMDCGHFLPKSLGLAIYFEPRNCAAQCQRCNLTLQGNQHAYALALIDRYGEEVIEELDAQRKNIRKIPSWEYEEMIEAYSAKLATLDAAGKGMK